MLYILGRSIIRPSFAAFVSPAPLRRTQFAWPSSTMGKRKIASTSNQENHPTEEAPELTPSRRRKARKSLDDTGAADAQTTASTSASKRKSPRIKKTSVSSATTDHEPGPLSEETNTVPEDGAAATAAPAKPKTKGRAKKPKPEPLPVWSPAMRPPPWEGPGFRVLSWNVAGLRAVLKKDQDVFKRLAEQEQADAICVQETKIQDCHSEDLKEAVQLPGWHKYWACSSSKAGYAGVAVFSKSQPLSVSYGLGLPEHDDEGRVITAEYEGMYLVNVYTPNSGEGLKRLDYRIKQWDVVFCDHVKNLEKKGKPVVLTGDLNCAHEAIDIHNPKGNERSAGYTIEERTSFSERYTSNGLVDTFRAQHPGVVGYSYWTYKFNCRAKNKGWRLDYFLVSEGLMPRVHDSYMLQDVMGSDHCPLGLVVKPPPAAA